MSSRELTNMQVTSLYKTFNFYSIFTKYIHCVYKNAVVVKLSPL